MKILVLVPEEQDSISQHLTKESRRSYNLTVTTYESIYDLSLYDKVFVYISEQKGSLSDESVKTLVGNKVFDALQSNATLLLPHHYSCSTEYLTFDNICINLSQILNPYKSLALFSTTKFIERQNLSQDDKDFILLNNNHIMMYVAGTNNNTEAHAIMPVLSIDNTIRCNFEVEKFFNSKYCSIDDIKKRGNLFWRINYYNFWGSFYDSLNR